MTESPLAPARISKVPEVTLLFWILKIAATTLGATAGDAVSMSLGFGYLAGTAIFAAAFAVAVAVQIRAERFHFLQHRTDDAGEGTFPSRMGRADDARS